MIDFFKTLIYNKVNVITKTYSNIILNYKVWILLVTQGIWFHKTIG